MSQIQLDNSTAKSFVRCSRCCMDTTDPDIRFTEGVCNYCQDLTVKRRELKIQQLDRPWVYNKLRSGGCIIGLSGGVDSSLCLHYLIENGIYPKATFSVDNGWNTKEADENIMKLVEGLKVPFYRYVLRQPNFRNLQQAFLCSGTKNVEIPTDHVLMACSYQMAVEQGVKYIVGGGNIATEGVMPRAWGYQARDLRFIKAIHKKFMGERLAGVPTISLTKYLYYRFWKKIEVINLLDYYDYNRNKAKNMLADIYGWKDYGEKHCESKFTMWFQNRYLPIKFGIDKRLPHYSSLINSGQMTRDEALKLLKEPLLYPELGFSLNYKKHSYKDFPNSEWIWNLLSKIKKWSVE